MPIARLIAIADALQAPVGDFIHGLPAAAPASMEPEPANWRGIDEPRQMTA